MDWTGNKKSAFVYNGASNHSANAVEGLRKTLCRELTAENDMELYEAVRAFKGIAEELEKATEGLR